MLITLSAWLFFFEDAASAPLPVDNPAAREIVWRNFNSNMVTQQNADIILSHPPRKVSQHHVAVFQLDAELGAGQSLGNHPIDLNFSFFFSHTFLQPDAHKIGRHSRGACKKQAGLFVRLTNLAAFDTSNGFLLFNAAQLTLRDKPALAANGAQDTALDDLFAESFKQLILRLVGA
jgi:hypothetical protein